MVDVIVKGGQCLAFRVIASRDDGVLVSIRAQGRDAELRTLDCWLMQDLDP